MGTMESGGENVFVAEIRLPEGTNPQEAKKLIEDNLSTSKFTVSSIEQRDLYWNRVKSGSSH